MAKVPESAWDAIAELGIDVVWLMGVWERSPAGIAVSMRNKGLLEDFHRALPDFTASDNVGSPYCVRNYVVDSHLGGPEGLAIARQELARRNLGLILDFVPNHVAPDHPWVTNHPEYFIRGDYDDLAHEPGAFVAVGGHVYACGRDPYFPAWPDVLQLNAFHDGLRAEISATVESIADQCDGVRCDMAMLMLNDIFQRTWGTRTGARPVKEYWPELIGKVGTVHPNFLFMAEAYWDLEWELQQQGFNFCYDKKLYDRLEHGSVESIRLHLCADLTYQERLVRFIENHDEPRAAAGFSLEKARAAAVIATTLPGAVLLHEGQFDGRKVRLPVFLGRRPNELVDQQLAAFYTHLLKLCRHERFREGTWSLCERSGWPENPSWQNILSWCWVKDGQYTLVVVNFSVEDAQARIHLPWNDPAGRTWRLDDQLSGETYDRDGDELRAAGLYVDLRPWAFHLFRLQPLPAIQRSSH